MNLNFLVCLDYKKEEHMDMLPYSHIHASVICFG